MNKNQKIDFGFEEITVSEKQQRVKGVFDSVANKYDIMNDFMSFGLHRMWKHEFTSMLKLSDGNQLLDLAGGTGDISFLLQKRAEKQGINIEIIVSDINEEMLKNGKARAIDEGKIQGLKWQQANAEKLPWDDNSFDYCTMAFGIRNVTDRAKALSEIHRTLKPGGQFFCLEFSHVKQPTLKNIYDRYSLNIIPKIGQLVAGDGDSYKYLVESIRMFPTANEFKAMFEDAGFSQCKFKLLTGGVVAIHSGWKV